MDFTINDEPASRIAIADTVRRYLDALPHGKMLTTPRVAENTNLEVRQVNYIKTVLPTHCVSIRSNLNIWGNPETIRDYKNELRRTA